MKQGASLGVGEEYVRMPFVALLEVAKEDYQWDSSQYSLVFPGQCFDVENRTSDLRLRGEDLNNTPWLTRPGPAFEGYKFSTKNPFQKLNLHRHFAKVYPEEEAIKKFAAKHGFLGHPLVLYNKEDLSSGARFAESLVFWQQEIKWMSRLLAVWDFIKREDERGLDKYIKWERSPMSVRFEWCEIGGKEQKVEIPADKAKLKQWGEEKKLIEPARWFLHLHLNQMVKGHINPVISSMNPDEAILHEADCLLASLYMLFMLEVSGRKHPEDTRNKSRFCKGCGTPFVPTVAQQTHCTPQCRKRKYWHRTPTSPKNRRKEQH